MKVVLVNGSPRKNGSTARALAEIEKTLIEEGIEVIHHWIGNQPISGCIACEGCYRTGKCVIEDQVNVFNEMAKDVDGFIFGSPVHYAGGSGGLIAFMDRVFYSGNKENFSLKPAAAISVARRAGTVTTMDQINKYFSISEMPIISSKYWNNIHGNKPSELEEDLEGLQIMRVLARNMAFFLKCKKVALENGVEMPKKEERVSTNFIKK